MKNRTTKGSTPSRSTTRTDRWARLRDAVQCNFSLAEIEAPDRWRTIGDDGIWRAIVGQVAVIGRSQPWEKLTNAWSSSGLDYASLLPVLDTGGIEPVASLVQKCFAGVGVRYAGTAEVPSAKARACARNLLRIHALGGPMPIRLPHPVSLGNGKQVSRHTHRAVSARRLPDDDAMRHARNARASVSLRRL